MTRAGDRITLRAEVDGEGYASFSRSDFDVVIHGSGTDAVVVDGTSQALTGGRLTVPNDGTPFTVEFAAD